MTYLDFGCNIDCWKCEKDCDFGFLLEMSLMNPIFLKILYQYLIEKLKNQTTILIKQGKNPIIIHEDFNIILTSFFMAWLKLSESLLEEA